MPQPLPSKSHKKTYYISIFFLKFSIKILYNLQYGKGQYISMFLIITDS
jgi:hypothetical protein